ncbi:MAG: hypothetical protein GXX96_32525 [Planctomycetaceae bacterium]|nr:hypothetical protein [Planctomycetaceae bacterium]
MLDGECFESEYALDATLLAVGAGTTTEVHILHNGTSVFRGKIRLGGAGEGTTRSE